jgi:hypothetical protein
MPPSLAACHSFFNARCFAQEVILLPVAPIVLAVKASAARATADHARQATVGQLGNRQLMQRSARRESLPAITMRPNSSGG